MELLQVEMSGWTATPRMPFILSGNAICMPTPSYSLLLGVIGCCIGRNVVPGEVRFGFQYAYDGVAKDVETRQRLKLEKNRIKPHAKGTDAYTREFHVSPRLTLWLNRLDWADMFNYPKGSPALGRSQDLMVINSVQNVEVKKINKGRIHGTMLPYSRELLVPGQLVQMAEAFHENDTVNGGRLSTASRIFISIPFESPIEVEHEELYLLPDNRIVYLHKWKEANES